MEKINKILKDESVEKVLIIFAIFLFFAPILPNIFKLMSFINIDDKELKWIIESLQLSVVIYFALSLLKNTEIRHAKISSTKKIMQIALRSKKYQSIDVRCMNSWRIVDELKELNIEVNNLRLIMPSEDCLKKFYNNHHYKDSNSNLVTNPKDAIEEILQHRVSAERQISSLIKNGKIKECEIIEIESFSLDFAIICNSGLTTIVGRYSPDPSRIDSTGLSSKAYIEQNPSNSESYNSDFDNLWRSIENKDKIQRYVFDGLQSI
ncbi:hypothetical protein [Vibrio nigripulchritudo]|uniref:hypothetical protein n=1 Tax=Vibrio nigripulchritudo TaxID=28173 RepID=UPI0003B24221|nr:hypothetical protein [Vibrio nigripulchritudo]CCN69744.1 hypothetical protein VIBNISFn118_1490004 [Vibrio nigripulchritudo SFn118]